MDLLVLTRVLEEGGEEEAAGEAAEAVDILVLVEGGCPLAALSALTCI